MAIDQAALNIFKKFANEKVAIVMALSQESNQHLEKNGYRVFYTGVGLVNSALSLTRFIEVAHPERIINLGTAGSLNIPIGKIVEVSGVVQREPIVHFLKKEIRLNCITSLPQVVCGSADHIETLEKDQKYIYDIVDMECYSLAKVCQSYKLPFHSIKFITDMSNDQTQDVWKLNLEKSSLKFIETLNHLNQ